MFTIFCQKEFVCHEIFRLMVTPDSQCTKLCLIQNCIDTVFPSINEFLSRACCILPNLKECYFILIGNTLKAYMI